MVGVGASQMMTVAIGRLMSELKGSAWDLGLVGLFQFVPAFVLTLLAGQTADRHRRARIVAVTLAVQGLVALCLTLSPLPGLLQRMLLLALSIVLGSARALQMTAQQALVPQTVPGALLPRAVAFSSTGRQFAIIGGPALGGVLYVFGPAVVIGCCTAMFAVAAVLCAAIRHASVPTPAANDLTSVFAGVRFVWHDKVVPGAISLEPFAVLLGGVTALLPIFAKDILHAGRGHWGCCARRPPSAPCSCRFG